MAERRFCNPNVVGSTPIGSSRAKAHPNNSLLMTHRKDGAGLLMDMVHVTNASSRSGRRARNRLLNNSMRGSLTEELRVLERGSAAKRP